MDEDTGKNARANLPSGRLGGAGEITAGAATLGHSGLASLHIANPGQGLVPSFSSQQGWSKNLPRRQAKFGRSILASTPNDHPAFGQAGMHQDGEPGY